MNILSVEFCTKLLQLLIFLVKLLYHILYSALHLLALERTFAELVLKFLNELTVLRHFARDEFHILFNLACLVGAFTILHDVHSVFSLINFSEALLNLVECAHHVVDFIIALCNNTLQTVGLGHTLYRRSFALTIAASQK